jgi:hypothetical protein
MVWSNKKLKDESLDKILLEYKLINWDIKTYTYFNFTIDKIKKVWNNT